MQGHINPMPVEDPWLLHAIQRIKKDYGHDVSVRVKGKDLLKFGRNKVVGTTEATLMHQQAGEVHETYVSSNLINSVISSSGSDTEEIAIEGHTSPDGLIFTFVSQTVTLTGQTAAALTTPLARVSRMYNNNGTPLVGAIAVTETDTYTAGVPNTAIKQHLHVDAGEQNSDKAATTVSNEDYWIVLSFYGDVLSKTAAFAEIHLETRLAGKVFRDTLMKSASDGHDAEHEFKPYLVVPPNSDVRLVAAADGSNTDISGGIQGVLAKIV